MIGRIIIAAIIINIYIIAFAKGEPLKISVNGGNPEITCLAEAIYFEARSEPIEGQIMVAKVIINRVIMDKWKTTICGVVKQHKQFSYLYDTKVIVYNSKAWEVATIVAFDMMEGKYNDFISEKWKWVTHYHTFRVEPNWAKKLTYIGQIGAHKFYM